MATDKNLDRTYRVKMGIDTGKHPPVKNKYRIPLTRPSMDAKAIETLHRNIETFIIVLTQKNNGTKCFCVDYRCLN